MLVKGHKYTQGDIKCPIKGKCEITSRASPNPAYQSELLWSFRYWLVTKNGDIMMGDEDFVFRLQDGELSLWYKYGDGTVTERMTKLMLEHELYPHHAKMRSAEHPWEDDDDDGMSKYLGLNFDIGESPYWMTYHRLEHKEGGEEDAGD